MNLFTRRRSRSILPVTEVDELRCENTLLRNALREKEACIVRLEAQIPARGVGSEYGPVFPNDGSVGKRMHQLIISEMEGMLSQLSTTNGMLEDYVKSLSSVKLDEINLPLLSEVNIRGIEDVHLRILELNKLIGRNRSYVMGLSKKQNQPHPPPVAEDQPGLNCKSRRTRREGAISVRVSLSERAVTPIACVVVGSWGEAAECPGFEVSCALPGRADPGA